MLHDIDHPQRRVSVARAASTLRGLQLPWWLAAIVLAKGLDSLTTAAVVATPGLREANPVVGAAHDALGLAAGELVVWTAAVVLLAGFAVAVGRFGGAVTTLHRTRYAEVVAAVDVLLFAGAAGHNLVLLL